MSYYLPNGDFVMEMKQTNDEIWRARLTDEELEDLFREVEEKRKAKEKRK